MSNYIKEKNVFKAYTKEEILNTCTIEAWEKISSLVIMDIGKYLVAIEPTNIKGRWQLVVTDGEYETRCYIAYRENLREYHIVQDNDYCMTKTIRDRILSKKYIAIGQNLGFTI